MYFLLLFKYLILFHNKNDLAPVASFLLLAIASNFRRVANFGFDFNKLRTTQEEKQECLCPQTGCLVQE